MNLPHNAALYECPERQSQGPLLLQADGPHGPFVAQRAIDGSWARLVAMPDLPAPAWSEVKNELACEVLYVGAVAALWPGLDPWRTVQKPV